MTAGSGRRGRSRIGSRPHLCAGGHELRGAVPCDRTSVCRRRSLRPPRSQRRPSRASATSVPRAAADPKTVVIERDDQTRAVRRPRERATAHPRSTGQQSACAAAGNWRTRRTGPSLDRSQYATRRPSGETSGVGGEGPFFRRERADDDVARLAPHGGTLVWTTKPKRSSSIDCEDVGEASRRRRSRPSRSRGRRSRGSARPCRGDGLPLGVTDGEATPPRSRSTRPAITATRTMAINAAYAPRRLTNEASHASVAAPHDRCVTRCVPGLLATRWPCAVRCRTV